MPHLRFFNARLDIDEADAGARNPGAKDGIVARAGRVAKYRDGVFHEAIGIAVCRGQRVYPAGWDPRADAPAVPALAGALDALRAEIAGEFARRPGHLDHIACWRRAGIMGAAAVAALKRRVPHLDVTILTLDPRWPNAACSPCRRCWASMPIWVWVRPARAGPLVTGHAAGMAAQAMMRYAAMLARGARAAAPAAAHHSTGMP